MCDAPTLQFFSAALLKVQSGFRLNPNSGKSPGLCQKSRTLPKVPNFARNPAVNNRIVTHIVIYNYLTTHTSFLSNNAKQDAQLPAEFLSDFCP
jgi:hypothetical protein